MTRKRWTAVAASILFLGIVVVQTTYWPAAHSEEKKTLTQSDSVAETLKAMAVKFEKAFNSGNVKQISELFSQTAEVIDEEGALVQGRADIEARFAESFKNYPKARIQVEVTSTRQLTPSLAIEDGTSTLTLDPDAAAVRSPYTIIHVKTDGVWQFASVRDFPGEPLQTAHAQLEPLAWLVGHWMDESHHGYVETSVKWSDDKNYLLQEYVVKHRKGGEVRGVQRIGYDPLRRTIRAWAFDQSGAFAESTWTPVEGTWVIKAEGFTPSGEAASATRVLTPLTNDSYQLESTSQFVGDERLPDSSIRVVRRPPSPTE